MNPNNLHNAEQRSDPKTAPRGHSMSRPPAGDELRCDVSPVIVDNDSQDQDLSSTGPVAFFHSIIEVRLLERRFLRIVLHNGPKGTTAHSIRSMVDYNPWVLSLNSVSKAGSRLAGSLRVSLSVLVCWLALAGSAHAEARSPRIFLSCPQSCFEPYLKQELNYFDVVRDRHEADFLLLIVRQRAAGGGERITLTVLLQPLPLADLSPPSGTPVRARHGEVRRQNAVAPARPSYTRELYSPPGAPAELTRKMLLGAVVGALFVELADTEHQSAFSVVLKRRNGRELSQIDDPWDYWTVTPATDGNVELGRGFHFAYLDSSLTLRRTTDKDKLRLRGSYSRQFSRFHLEDGSNVRGDVYGWAGRALYARSLGKHWALGSAGTVASREYENLKTHTHFGPVLELNIFPYDRNASEQLRMAYQAGVWTNWYFEPNVAGRMRESRHYQALTMIADLNQRWGTVQLAVQLNSFLNEPKLARLASTASLNLQLFEGFALNLLGGASWIGDQISLRRHPLSDVELLLATAQQPTDYSVTFEFGFSYTFGSVHNTIVNPRFGRLDLEED
jgi:hypothetical protein